VRTVSAGASCAKLENRDGGRERVFPWTGFIEIAGTNCMVLDDYRRHVRFDVQELGRSSLFCRRERVIN
jgi:hypothetical protein